MMDEKIFKGFEYYELTQDSDGNIILGDYNDVLNARRARMDMLWDNLSQYDINFVKLNKAFNEKFMSDEKLLSRIYNEDKEIALERDKVLSILDNLDNLSSIDTLDLLAISLLLSDISNIEKDIVLGGNTEFSELKDLFLEKKESGEYYTDEEYRELANYVDCVNYQIQLELIQRSENKNLNNDKNNNDKNNKEE
ncbi:hypothetical protein BIY23_01100 [Wolbachia pipientis]|uniref:Uncharacterized protein n=1 Tax=Wolbachia pipientis TaxID=955 RepID=A0A1E7QLH6_WOLPI|nr:hypothetical protein [Wolbachia pipientis]OEY87069.1 hypothetical protein BIY23_01100 [Wolbachia pipientis]